MWAMYVSVMWIITDNCALFLAGAGRRLHTFFLIKENKWIRTFCDMKCNKQLCLYFVSYKGGITCWYNHRTRSRKFASLNPGRSGRRIFFPAFNFVCWLLFGVHFTPVLSQWHVKDPGHSAQSAGGRLHLNTHTPLTQRSRSGLTIPLSRNSVGTNPETCSHATCQGAFGYSHLSSLSHCGRILA